MKTFTAEELAQRYGAESLNIFSAPNSSQPQSTTSQLSDIGHSAWDNITSAIKGEGNYQGESPIRRGVEATATAFGVPIQGAMAMAPQPVQDAAKATGDTISQGFSALTHLIGSNPQLQEWAKNHPDAVNKISEVAGTAAAGGQIAGDILTYNGAAGTLQKGVDAATTGSSKIVDATKSAASSLPTPKLDDASSHIMDRVARVTPKQAQQFKQLSGGKTIGEYLTETGNTNAPGKLILTEAQKFARSMADVDDALSKIPGVHNDPALKEALKSLRDKAISTSAGGVKSPYYRDVMNLIKKYKDQGGLDMTDTNSVKRLFERHEKLSYNKLTSSDKLERATNIDNQLRKWQFKVASENGFKNIAEMNKQTQLSKFIVDKLGDSIVGKSGLNSINLTDWIVLSGGDPTAVSGFVTKKFLSNKSVQARIAKMLNNKDVKPYISPTQD